MDIFLVITLIIIVVLVIHSRRKAIFNGNDLSAEKSASTTSEVFGVERVQGGGITIPIERLPATTKIEEKSLFEITDSKVIARISETIPTAAETVAKTIINKALKNIELASSVVPSSQG